MTKTRFTVLNGSLVLDDVEYPGGDNEADLNKTQLKLLNHAYAAGAVDFEGADPEAYGVQSQEDGEKAYTAAQESGSWHEGNALAVEEQALSAAEMPVDVEGEGS